MSIKELKVEIEEEDDFKSLYICALMMMCATEDELLFTHSECVSMRDQMHFIDDETDDPTLGSIH